MWIGDYTCLPLTYIYMEALLFLNLHGTLMEEIYLCYLNLSNILTACQIIENVGNKYKG